MKNKEKELLLLDYENHIMQYQRKIELLDKIILFYNDEEYISNSNIDDVKKDKVNVIDIYDDSQDINNNDNQDINNSYEIENIKEDLLPQDIKILYRKIMMITHPDKIKNKDEEKEYTYYYKKAIEAKNENNKSEIIFIAFKLNIDDVYKIDNENFGNIKYNIAKLNIDINNIENNPYWIWYYTNNEILKKLMEKQIRKYN